MERLLTGPGWRREERRYPPPPSSPHITRTPALSMASAPKPGHSSRQFPPEMPLTITNEKESLRGLNDRFAGFIEKVHRLESQNRALEREIEDIRLKAKSSASLAKQYEPELQDLRRQVREMAVQKHQMELEQKRVEDEFTALREKCEDEARSRAEAEESISALKKYIDSANLAKQEMDTKAKALTEEIEFLKRNHEAEVTDILTQMKETRVPAEVSSFGKGELTAALRDIRTQLEARAVCLDTHSEQRFSTQLAKLTKAAESDRDALMATKAEISQYRRQLQTKNVELDSVRGMRGAMERQLYDLEQRHTAEIHHYQDTIRELEQELKNTKDDMSSHMQEYHDLLNVKMALDAEIYSYRKLLEGEESRYSTLSDTQIPVPYVYRQSPIYTLPSLPRMAGVTRKAEPQYKFVEEIITETTSEDIEISDTGSEDAEELMVGDKVCIEKEYANAEAGSEADLEGTKSQESGAEDNTGSSVAEQLDNKEKPTEEEEQPLKESTDISVDLKECDMDTELAQDNLTASEETGEKDTDSIYKQVNETDSKTKDIKLDTKTEKTKSDVSGDVEEKVALDIENVKQDIAKEIDQATNEEPKPTVQTARQEAITESAKTLTEETSPEFEDVKVKTESHHVVKHEDSSNRKTQDKDRETSEMNSMEVDTSPADQQPVCQKAEAGQETRPDSEADSKQSAETSQADVLDITKAASAQDKSAEVQKKLAEKVKAEAPVLGEVKEIEYKEDKKEDSTETVKPEMRPEETSKTPDVSKDHPKETKIEPFERKDTSPADQQPVHQKVKAGQETRPDSEADLKQSFKTSQTDVLDITKAASAQDKEEEVQKELAEKVKTEAPVQGKVKEIESKVDKKEDITETVKPEKEPEETPITQEDVSKALTKETKVEPSERKDASPADQQPVRQKVEAGQETLPKSEAELKQSVETSQADVLDITKAASAQDKKAEMQKELAEKVKAEAPVQGKVKEIESKEDKKEDITETVKPEMRPEETPKTQDASKDHYKETKVEPSERKDTSPADQQPVCQKADAGQERHSDSEADSKQSVETSQADVLDITKAASAQDEKAEVQKELAEKAKTEAPVQGDVKEIESKDDKNKDIIGTVKPEKGQEETPKTQEDVSKGHPKETKVEPSERKDTSPADQQPVHQKVEAGQETRPDSKADSKQSAETSQADVLDITKAASAQDKKAEMQKELAEKVKTEAPVQGKVKEIESKVDKKEDITETVKPEKEPEETPITQEDVSKSPTKETKVEPSERKDASPADQQPVRQKVEAGQETLPKSEAELKQSVETSQADVLDITKAASAQDKKAEMQKELAEKVKAEAPVQGKVKEIESKEDKKEDITETVKPEMRPEETPKTQDASKDHYKETKVEPSERKDTSPADQQPVHQKVEAGQETRPDSKADSKQSAETSQADVLDITKAASAQDKKAEMQKELAEKVKTEAPVQGKVKEIESKEDKKVDITETVKPEKEPEETPKTQENVSKDHPKETKVEPSERKDTSPADQQPVHQKAEAGQETLPKSEAELKQSVETSQADVLDITKAASAQDKPDKVQKELAEKVKTEAPVKGEGKEIESKDEKKEDSTETVKPEKEPEEAPKAQEDVSKASTKETKIEPSERKETSPADQQPICQKVEAGQETRPDNEADSKQSIETSQTDVLDISKAASAQDKPDEVQKELAEKVKAEAPVQGEVKEIESKEEKKEDITETVKPEMRPEETPKTQDASKDHPKETKVEPSERKDTSPADQQPVCQKADAGQERHPDSEADSEQSVETSQTDAADITKAASAQDEKAEVQKELAEKAKTEAPVQGDVKEIESKDDKNKDITGTVKPEKGQEETPKTQEDVSKDHPKETKVEPSERKDTSPADQQPVHQKVEAGQETRPDSKADSKQSAETSQANVLDITKAASAQDKEAEVQKELAEKVSKEEKKEDSTEAVKPEKGGSAESTQAPKTQEDISKAPPRETKVEPSKEIQTKDIKESAKKDEGTESKKTDKEADQMQIKEQPKVAAMETKLEEKSHENADGTKEDMVASLKTEENIKTKSSEIHKEKFQEDKESKPHAKEIKSEHEKQKTQEKRSEDIKERDIIKPEGQELDSKTFKDVQPEQSVLKTSPEGPRKDQKDTDKDSHAIKDTKIEKSYETDTKPDSTKMDMTKSKELEL